MARIIFVDPRSEPHTIIYTMLKDTKERGAKNDRDQIPHITTPIALSIEGQNGINEAKIG